MLRRILVLSFLCASLAFPKTWFVAPQGSDAAAGTSAAPWKTLGKAHATMAAGDTTLVRGGTYAGTAVDWTRSGAAGKPLLIKAYPNETPVFTGAGVNHFATTTGDYLTFEGLEISGYAISAFNAKGGSFLTVRDCVMHDIAAVEYGAVTLQYVHDVLIEDNVFKHTGRSLTQTLFDHAIYDAAGSHDIVIRRNLFQDCYGGPAINHYHTPSPYNVAIYDNVFYMTLGSERSGIFVGDGAHDVDVYNNTFYTDGKGAQISIAVHLNSGDGTNEVVNNIFYGINGADANDAYVTTGTNLVDYNLYYPARDADDKGTHSLVGNPLFTDGPGADLHLGQGSAAIDKGKALALFTDDKDGNPRSATGYDLGAYEYRSPIAIAKGNRGPRAGSPNRMGWKPIYRRNGAGSKAFDAMGIRAR